MRSVWAQLDADWMTWMSLRYRTLRLLFVSWLIAFSVQFADSLLQTPPSDLSYAELLWFNLCHRGQTRDMYLGLCSAIGYLTDAVWKLVYRAVALSAAPEHFTDHVLLKLHDALFALQLFGFLIGAPTAGLLSFDMPIITGYVIIKWMVRAVRPLLLSAGRLTCVRAWVIYLLMIVGWPCAVVASISGPGLGFSYGTGVLVVRALNISVKAASILAQSLVTRCRAANAQTDELKFIIKVSICTSSCR